MVGLGIVCRERDKETCDYAVGVVWDYPVYTTEEIRPKLPRTLPHKPSGISVLGVRKILDGQLHEGSVKGKVFREFRCAWDRLWAKS